MTPDAAEPWAEPAPGELVVPKHTVNGFFKTGLEEELHRRGVTHVVVCGLVTSICVQGTIAGALERGFAVGGVPECCGDHTRERHEANWFLYGRYMYDIFTIEELRRGWSSKA